MPVQLNIFILLFGAMQAVLLLLLLFKKAKSLPGYSFLVAYLIVMTLQIIMKVISKIWLMETVRPLYSLSYELPFLYGPLIYLFARAATGPVKTGWRDMLHFLPILPAMVFFIFTNPHQPVPVLLQPLFNAFPVMMLQLISLFAYHRMAFCCLHHPADRSSLSLARMKWLRQFIILSIIVGSGIAIAICFMYKWYPYHQEIRGWFSLLTVFIYWISYKALAEPEIFSVIKGYGHHSPEKIMVSRLTVHHQAKKYTGSGLNKEILQSIVASAEKEMQAGKMYSDPELTIEQLAAIVACSRHHLSQALNSQLDKSFYDYVNAYRVQEAKQLLLDPAKAGYKIASIAYDAGFNSISTFNDVFKKMAGLTPSQFRKQLENKELKKQRV